MFLQGPTYALCYSAIVGYAAAVAPPGLSATLQGIMAGMDDGVGKSFLSMLIGIIEKSSLILIYDIFHFRFRLRIAYRRSIIQDFRREDRV